MAELCFTEEMEGLKCVSVCVLPDQTSNVWWRANSWKLDVLLLQWRPFEITQELCAAVVLALKLSKHPSSSYISV